MGSLSIVASQQEYKIVDHDAGEILVTGIGSLVEKTILKNKLSRYSRRGV